MRDHQIPSTTALLTERKTLSQKKPEISFEVFSEFVLEHGVQYIECGGPVSRLEQRIHAASTLYGFQSQVFATPTILLMSAYRKPGDDPCTYIRRINTQNIHLLKLKKLERLLDRFSKGRLYLPRAQRALLKEINTQRDYPTFYRHLASAVIGFSVTFPLSNSLEASLVSAAMCLGVSLLSPWLSKRYSIQGFFMEFLVCLFAIGLAQALSVPLKENPFEIVLGVLVLLVPGLSLTVSISEISSGDIISGVIRLFRAFITLLAMGLAWLLMKEIGDVHSIQLHAERLPASTTFWLQHTTFYASKIFLVLSFCIYFNSPRKSLFRTLITGFFGVSAYHLATIYGFSLMASFLGALTVGAFSQFFGKRSKIPSQIYSTPAILILVPGMLALSSFQKLNVSATDIPSDSFLRAFMTAAAIVFGLMCAKLPFKAKHDGSL